jgi:uncharacterized Ntn-hydrolase superfamily protein
VNIDLTHKGAMLTVMARVPGVGTLGIALASSSIAVGSRCPHIETGRVAVASQGFTNLKVGALALDLVRCGLTAAEVMEALRQHDRWLDYRQIGIMTADGQVEAHTGGLVTGQAAHRLGPNALCLCNGLPDVDRPLDAALAGFAAAGEGSGASLADRLLAALESAKTMLGEAFPVTSASLLVRSPAAESQIDLRVDMPSRPIEAGGNALVDLRRLHDEYLPLVDIYAARSVAPRAF